MSSMVAHCAVFFFEERRNGSGFLYLVILCAHEPMIRLRSPIYVSLKIRYPLLKSSPLHNPGTFIWSQTSRMLSSRWRTDSHAISASVDRALGRKISTCQAWEGILSTSLHFRRLFPTSSMECQVLTKDAIDWITMTDASIETVIEIRGETMTFDGTVVVREEDLPATGFRQK